MTDDQIADIVRTWYGSGHITAEEKEEVKRYYFRISGIDENTVPCKRCPSFWWDVQTIVRIHLRKLGYTMKNNREYTLAEGEVIHEMSTGIHYVASGTESEYTKILTDEKAKEFLAKDEGYASIIVKNPDYVAPDQAAAGEPNGGSGRRTSTAAATAARQAKAAAKKAEEAAAKKAEEAAEEAKKKGDAERKAEDSKKVENATALAAAAEAYDGTGAGPLDGPVDDEVPNDPEGDDDDDLPFEEDEEDGEENEEDNLPV